MKRYQHVLTIASILLASAVSSAGYDEFDCVTNESLSLSGLQCVSCGISKYYADKGEDVTPSHRWLAVLATKVRELNLDSNSKGPVTSSEAQRNLQIQVIKKIQAYGFCAQYVGKNTGGRSKNMHDMSASDWKVFFEFINRDNVPGKDGYEKLAKSLGFKSSLFGNSARQNMEYLFEGFYDNLSLDDKRALFKERIKQGLGSEYDVAGERQTKSVDFIASGDKDQGLRDCLADIKHRFLDQPMSDKETYKMCEVVANACDLDRTPMSNNDFCVHKGMALRPASSVSPRPVGPPPPPPGKAGNRSGVK